MRSVRHRCRGLLVATLLLVLAACSPQESPPAPRPSLRHGDAAAGQTGRPGAVLQVRSIRVQDGDSFVGRLDDGRRITIRLSGIDAPERAQPYANVARRNLLRLLDDGPLQVHVAKYDQYGRAVAQVFTAGKGGSVDVGLAQLQDGLAWFYRRYRNDLPAAAREPYAAAEEAARSARRGLWQADAQSPWEFRRRGRDARNPRSDSYGAGGVLLLPFFASAVEAGSRSRWRTVS
jgi:endonuclease YncB( thermonuclease family)